MNKTPGDAIEGGDYSNITGTRQVHRCPLCVCTSFKAQTHNIVACYPSQLADRASGESVLRDDKPEEAFSPLPQLNFRG